MASPSRKYHFASGAGNTNTTELDSNSPNLDPSASKKRVSRVDSFRNFFMLTSTHATSPASTSLKTPRAVKRRSNRSAGSVASGKTSEAGTQSELRLRLPSEGYFGSDLTLNEYGGGSEVGGVSECQSEVDLRYNVASGSRFSGGGGGSRSYVGGAYDTDHEDERSVVSDSNHHLPASSR